ncbi:calymmin [Betta splendens]|uniref:Calymmin n=1 Tax=Betta splendens TaxID=158456 RepID=A0A9W2XG88_BETSP|nr:calymmin [Betta splendens]
MFFKCPIIQLVFVHLECLSPRGGGRRVGGRRGRFGPEWILGRRHQGTWPLVEICSALLGLLPGQKPSSRSSMWGQLLVQTVAMLWMAQAAYTKGYGAASGISNGHGPQLNGNHPPNSGVGRFLLPSKGVGAQSGYGGYATKGTGYGPATSVSSANAAKPNGYGAAAGGTKGNNKGYGAAASGTNGHGHGAQAGPVNGQRVKGNGHGAQAGFGGQGNKGFGYGAAAGALGLNGAKQNGHGAAASAQYGFGTKGNGRGAVAGPSNNYGARPGQAQHKPLKGYGRPPYGSVKGPGVGMGAFRGVGAPQAGRNQKAYGSNGQNGYGAQPVGGYSGGHGSAGLALGSQYGHGRFKGPKQGYAGAAARPNGQHGNAKGYGFPSGGNTKPANPGYGNIQSGFGAKQKGYGAFRGAAVRPQTGYGNGAALNGYKNKPNGYGTAAGPGVTKPYGAKPNGYGVRNGAALGGYGSQLNGHGAASKLHTTKGVGAASPSQGAATLGTGYDGAADAWSGQIAKAANSGYGSLPNAKASKTTGASSDSTLYALSPEQLDPALLGSVPQPAMSNQQPAPEPTSGVLVRVTPEQHHSPVPQGKAYKQPPQALSEHPPMLLQGKGPKPAPQPTPESAHMGPEGPAAVFTQSNPPPEPAAVLPEGKWPEPEPLESKAQLKHACFCCHWSHIRSLRLDHFSLNPMCFCIVGIGGASVTKGQGAEADCDPSVPNGQWVKIPRPGLKAGAEAAAGTMTKGYGASAGGYANGGAAIANTPGKEPHAVDSHLTITLWVKALRYVWNHYSGSEISCNDVVNIYVGLCSSACLVAFSVSEGFVSSKASAAAGFALPGLFPGYGPGLGYPYAGKPKQPGYGHGAYLGAGYENGNSHKGYGNGFRAGVQPDYASLGQATPSVDAKSGGAKPSPHHGAQMVPTGLDGMGSFPFGGQTPGAEKANGKYGVGGFQFAGQPFSSAGNGAGIYGGLGAGIGGVPVPGKYGYGTLAYQAQPVALGPELKSIGKYGLPASPYQPQQHGGHFGKYGGEAANALQGLGGEAKSSGKYDKQGEGRVQPLESTSEGTSDAQYGAAGLAHQPLPVEPHSAGKPYVKGEVPAPAGAAAVEGLPVGTYDNAGYINGQVQPEVVAFPAAPSLDSIPASPSVPAHLTEAVPEAHLDPAPASEAQGEQPDEPQQQLPRQIHIQQHLKLHFHPQSKSWRGANNEKHDLKGFFGNSGHQG